MTFPQNSTIPTFSFTPVNDQRVRYHSVRVRYYEDPKSPFKVHMIYRSKPITTWTPGEPIEVIFGTDSDNQGTGEYLEPGKDYQVRVDAQNPYAWEGSLCYGYPPPPYQLWESSFGARSIAYFILNDEDGDLIENSVDTDSTHFSNDFSKTKNTQNGTITTYGRIIDRANQLVIITDDQPSDGVRIRAGNWGATSSAKVSVCDSAVLTLNNPGDEVVVTCGSVKIDVLNGTVGATFTATDGTIAETSLNEGNSLEFEPTAFTFTAPESNEEPVVIIVGDKEFTVAAGANLKPISIDIKPRSYPNTINLGSKGTIPVAILSSETFYSPTQIDTSSLTFGRTGAENSLAFCNTRPEDVNKDKLGDLICHFNPQSTDFKTTDKIGIFKGRTVDGTPIEGQDSVKILP